MTAYYNEIDIFCCAWLSNLMDAGHITPGRIDDRSIVDVRPEDVELMGFPAAWGNCAPRVTPLTYKLPQSS